MKKRQRPESSPENGKKPKKKSLIRRIFKLFFILGFSLVVIGAGVAVGLYRHLSRDLPKISSLRDYRPPVITTVYADNNEKIAEFYTERRVVIGIHQMPDLLIKAFIAAEDSRFLTHKGIDIISIFRAFFKNLEAGTIVQGGSTITQQVTKSFFLTPERSYTRKAKEAIMAFQIDRHFTKREILYLYLNQIYLGHGAYGVEAAAQNYFGKPAKELNLAECAIIAGLPQAPSRYSPFKHPERAKERQIYVLNRMVTEGFISQTDATMAMNTPLDIHPRRNWYMETAPYYTEYVRQYVAEKYGEKTLYTGGLQIYTAVNLEMQKIAREEVEKGLRDLDKRQGWRGPLTQITPEQIEDFVKGLEKEAAEAPLESGKIVKGVVVDVDDKKGRVSVRLGGGVGDIDIKNMTWARKPNYKVPYYAAGIKKPGQALSVGDVIQVELLEPDKDKQSWRLSLEQEPIAQGAHLCLEAATGFVKAMIGGRDFSQSQFNRALQSRRQPGSSFKPIIYAAAMDKGYTPASVIIDSPIIYNDREHDRKWKPKNYKEKFYGPTLLRKALAKSRNLVTIKLLQGIGIDYAIEYAKKLGIESQLARDLSISLGSSGVSLLEMVRAYSVFANYGILRAPVFVTKILDRNGNVLEEAHPEDHRAIEESTAYIMTSLLQSVVENGTGARAKALKRPVAGKTGTSNDLYDAWFLGYTPSYVVGTWVGFDEERSLGEGETGSRAACPIWVGFFQRILKDKPKEVFRVPENVVFAKIDAQTGLLPIAQSQKTLFECFKEGTVPTEHTRPPDAITEPEQFFKSVM